MQQTIISKEGRKAIPSVKLCYYYVITKIVQNTNTEIYSRYSKLYKMKS